MSNVPNVKKGESFALITKSEKGATMEIRTKTKRYNTDTALKVLTIEGETLYRKRIGEFFLADDEGITPLIYDQAKEWASRTDDKKTFAAFFGKVQEGKKVIRTFSLSEGVIEIAKREAARTGESLSDVVARAIMYAYS